ncbi:MAG TPA: glycosyltransferase [Syntrophorhabdaceae bacterium]|nr:glycosyltransferase [Syntrophorhabdaceae bacterium]
MRSQNPLISVIIPTYNRADLLRSSLESLLRQKLSKSAFEVIVVNDGSTDSTEDICQSFRQLMDIKHVYQRNSGISAAKNLGILLSRAPFLLFFDDDDIAENDLLAQHARFHMQYKDENIACLGFTTWHPSLNVTPVMEYITEIGQFLFSYKSLKHGQELDFTYFWGGRTSCKRSFLVKHGIFNQDFTSIIEDIELGYRLSKFGLKVIFNKDAKSYMIRPITYDQFCARCERTGNALYLFSTLHPDPIVQKYCIRPMAEKKWGQIREQIEQVVDKVHEIESHLFSHDVSETQRRLLLDELYKLYEWSFTAFKIKGIINARESKKHIIDHIDRGSISEKDVSLYKEKWKSLPHESRLKILVIDHFLPMFDRASGSLRLFNIIKALKTLKNHVTFLALNNDFESTYRPILEDLGVETYTLQNLVTQGKNRIKEWLETSEFEWAIIEFWKTGQTWIPVIRNITPHTKIIVDSVDIHFVREIREAELANDRELLRKAFKNKKEEIDTYRLADRVWVVTDKDKEAVEQFLPGIPIDIIPNIHERIQINKIFEDTSDLLFVGNFNHPPNRDAVFFFCKEIFPLIKKELRDVKLYIVGNNPQDDIRSLTCDDIIITGYVEDLSPYLSKSRISVAPLRYGAGMKGKIGEALSWGLPVVTSSIGAEGMGLIDGIHVQIADNPHEFAEKVIRLYKDKELWLKLSEEGKKFIEENYSSEAVEKRLKEVFSETNAQEKIFSEVVQDTKVDKKCVFVARLEGIDFPEPNFKDILTSIIIPVKDNWDYTKACLESVVRYTDVPYEIVIVDNGSEEPIFQYVKRWKDRNEKIPVRYLRFNENKGFAGGCNGGALVSSGDYLVFLNNDTLVTPSWLKGLLKPIISDNSIGITGPVSNYVNGGQRIKDCPIAFKSPANIDFGKLVAYASSISNKNSNTYMFTEVVMGLCLAIKKELFDGIGGFDEMFYPGNFEDADLSMRIHRMGLKPVICMDVFVYHFGNKTFGSKETDYKDAYKKNLARFRDKWKAISPMDEESMYHYILSHSSLIDKEAVPTKQNEIHHLIWTFDEKTIKDTIGFYLKGDLHKKMPLIIASNGQNLEKEAQLLQDAYPDGELEEKGDITLFGGGLKELLSQIEKEKRLFIYSFKSSISQDVIKSESMLLV